MRDVWWLAVFGVCAGAIGAGIGAMAGYALGSGHGERVSELKHGWVPALAPGAHRRRHRRHIDWPTADRNTPAPAESEPIASPAAPHH